MMMRLRDQDVFDNVDEAEAARLLRVLAPSAPSQSLENRLYARIHTRRLGSLRLVPTMVFGGVVLASTGILSATVVRHWRSSDVATPGQPAQSRAVGTMQATVVPALPTHAPETLPSDSIATPPAPSIAKTAPEDSRAARSAAVKASKRRLASFAERPRATVSHSDEVVSTEARAAAAPPEEGALVLAALRALRREKNPTRSGVLVNHYLASFPHGFLVEEALAIGIEAAQGRGDAPAGTRLASTYLHQFPSGRFVTIARKASSGDTP
jgi:hypothetical protein